MAVKPKQKPIVAGKCVSLRMDYAALDLLRDLAPSPFTQGRFLSRLIYEEVARRDERHRLLRALQGTPQAVPETGAYVQQDVEPYGLS